MKCPECKAEVRGRAKFCPGCGCNLAGAREAETKRTGEEPPPLPEEGERAWDQEEPPEPPPPVGEAAIIRSGAGGTEVLRQKLVAAVELGGESVELPAAGRRWAWRDHTTELARRILSGKEEPGVRAVPASKNFFDRMIRATLVDKSIYREVAANPKLNWEAWLVALVVIALSSLGWQLLTFRMWTLEAGTSLLATAVVQVAAWLARVWVIRYAAAKWFERKLDFRMLFRTVTYAQSAAVLQVIPVVGTFLSLWALVTTTAAIRDVTACDTKTAVILTLIGAVGVAAAVAVAGPVARAIF